MNEVASLCVVLHNTLLQIHNERLINKKKKGFHPLKHWRAFELEQYSGCVEFVTVVMQQQWQSQSEPIRARLHTEISNICHEYANWTEEIKSKSLVLISDALVPLPHLNPVWSAS